MTPENNPNQPRPNPTPGSAYNPPPTPPPSSYPPPRRSNTWIYGVVIAILLGACIYLFVTRNTIAEREQQALKDRDTVVIAKDQLQEEFNAASARLDAMVSDNEKLKGEIASKDGEIAKLKGEFKVIMSKTNKTEADYDRARKLISQLNDKISSYEERIAQLEGENKDLNDKVVSTTRERDSTVTQNIALKKVGSVLHASNIRLIPIDLRRNGTKERETGKAKRADVLRIIFDIDENRIAESGSKELYLRITGPEGSLLSNAAYGSGVTTSSDGAQIGYTLSKSVELIQNQPVKDVVINWKQDSDYKRGAYNIEIYNEGYKIGSGNVTLK